MFPPTLSIETLLNRFISTRHSELQQVFIIAVWVITMLRILEISFRNLGAFWDVIK